MTEINIEQAARALCRQRFENPDDLISQYGFKTRPRWEWAKLEVVATLCGLYGKPLNGFLSFALDNI